MMGSAELWSAKPSQRNSFLCKSVHRSLAPATTKNGTENGKRYAPFSVVAAEEFCKVSLTAMETKCLLVNFFEKVRRGDWMKTCVVQLLASKLTTMWGGTHARPSRVNCQFKYFHISLPIGRPCTDSKGNKACGSNDCFLLSVFFVVASVFLYVCASFCVV